MPVAWLLVWQWRALARGSFGKDVSWLAFNVDTVRMPTRGERSGEMDCRISGRYCWRLASASGGICGIGWRSGIVSRPGISELCAEAVVMRACVIGISRFAD